MKNKYLYHKVAGFFLVVLFAAVSYQVVNLKQDAQLSSKSSDDYKMLVEDQIIDYNKQIQPIFDKRCAVCHSCLTSPCQLNLQSFEGFLRGANKIDVYGQTRFHKDLPTRLGVDANTIQDWRNLNFFPILNSENPLTDNPIFSAMLSMKSSDPHLLPKKSALESRACVSNTEELIKYVKENPNSGMPYGLPKLNDKENNTLMTWVAKGAPGPSWEELQKAKIPTGENLAQVRSWESFLNGQSMKEKLVARYLYEHLFLAHIYFPNKPTEFYKLVRSRTACEKEIDVISSRRPFNNPFKYTDRDPVTGKKKKEKYYSFFYCLEKNTYTVMNKNHVPYEFSKAKMDRFKELFFQNDWDIKEMPSYAKEDASNPFETYKAIPVKSRYQFLLDDAGYHVNTFLKGPVCFGNAALNSIDEQFYVLFIKPESDLLVKNQNFYTKISPHLMLPAQYGSKKEAKIPALYKELVSNRNKYRVLRDQEYNDQFPKGYKIYDIWDGQGKNDNAILTIFRNRNSGMVLKGARGDLSKTTFVLDYALFERLVYSLVAGFDVYGDTTHQLLSRLYMDFIRMEAEENFLSFLPPEKRKPLHKFWYRGGLITRFRMKLQNSLLNLDEPTSVNYTNVDRAYEEFVEKVLFEYIPPNARGFVDLINWKTFNTPAVTQSLYNEDVPADEKMVNNELRKIASVKAKEKPFSNYFPDISYLRVHMGNKKSLVYTIVHHKEHTNIAWIFQEESRRDYKLDSLSVFKGIYGGFPNYFFDVDIKNLGEFITSVENMKTPADYIYLKGRFGVNRTNPYFWEYSDWINKTALAQNPTDSGYIDLSRYGEESDVEESFLDKSEAEIERMRSRK